MEDDGLSGNKLEREFHALVAGFQPDCVSVHFGRPVEQPDVHAAFRGACETGTLPGKALSIRKRAGWAIGQGEVCEIEVTYGPRVVRVAGIQRNSLAKEGELVPVPFARLVNKVTGEVPPLSAELRMRAVIAGKGPFPGPDRLPPVFRALSPPCANKMAAASTAPTVTEADLTADP